MLRWAIYCSYLLVVWAGYCTVLSCAGNAHRPIASGTPCFCLAFASIAAAPVGQPPSTKAAGAGPETGCSQLGDALATAVDF